MHMIEREPDGVSMRVQDLTWLKNFEFIPMQGCLQDGRGSSIRRKLNGCLEPSCC